MRKTRTITTEEEYDVCDLCGEEISACSGNTIHIDEKAYLVHLMTQYATTDGKGPAKLSCGMQLIIDTIEKKNKKAK